MKFTWPEKFTRTIEKVPDELLPKLIRAILAYGTDGVEPELDFPLDSIFESMREDIDNSHKFRDGGSRGGSRAKRVQGEADCEPGEADADGSWGAVGAPSVRVSPDMPGRRLTPSR